MQVDFFHLTENVNSYSRGKATNANRKCFKFHKIDDDGAEEENNHLSRDRVSSEFIKIIVKCVCR